MSRSATEPLRVLSYFSFPGGGIGRYTHHLLTALDAWPTLSVALLTQPNFAWRHEASYAVLPDLFSISHSVPTLRRARFVLGQIMNPRRLAAQARQVQPNIVHLADVNHLFLPAWRRALFGQRWRVVMTVHDVRRLAAILDAGWEDRQLRTVYRDCDALFVHSRAQRDELLEFAGVRPERVHIVPHGPYPSAPYVGGLSRPELRRQWGVPADAQVALFFGFIKPYKGLDVLLRAATGIESDRRLHVLVAGSAGGGRYQAYEDECRGLIESAELKGRVTTVIRHIEEQEIPELLELSDAIALPYRDVFTSQSGVLNLASHYRRPIVASPAPAFVEGQQSGEIGVIAQDFSVDAYSRALLRWLEAPQRAWAFDRYLGANSWERNAELTVDVYRQLLAGSA